MSKRYFAGLVAVAAVLGLGINHEAIGQQLARYITLMSSGGLAISSSTEGSLQPLHVAIVDPSTDALAPLTVEQTSDTDTGAGTQTTPVQGIALPASGGFVVGGTSTNPIRIDPSGTTTQPVSVSGVATAANQSTANTSLATIAGAEAGASGLRYNSVGTTEDEHAVKATPGVLWSISATNINTAARYLRCSNATAASTTPGTTTSVFSLAIPGAASGAGFHVDFPRGFAFSVALTCWLVTGADPADANEVAANEVKVFYTFY